MTMKRALLVGVALSVLGAVHVMAADLPNRRVAPAPAYIPPPVFSWTGFYAGVNGGGVFGDFTKGGKNAFGSPSGGLVGATAGYNQQYGNIVVGVEGDIDWADASNKKTLTGPVYTKGQLEALGTVRGRLGYAIDRVLLFGTAGYAGGEVKTSLTDVPNGLGFSDSSYRNGWVAGAGVEYAFTNNISAKAEYLYSQLESKTLFSAPDTTKAGINISTVRAGVNYKF
jgi:outer membrane immunogenic protein